MDAQNTFAIAVAGRGFDARISTEWNVGLPDSACVYCGNCIGVCPTGALMFRSEHEMREAGTWDESAQTVTDTICPYCGVGCTLSLHVQDNEIVKVTSPLDSSVTDGHLCVKGRFGFEFVQERGPPRRSVSGTGTRPTSPSRTIADLARLSISQSGHSSKNALRPSGIRQDGDRVEPARAITSAYRGPMERAAVDRCAGRMAGPIPVDPGVVEVAGPSAHRASGQGTWNEDPHGAASQLQARSAPGRRRR